MAASWRAHTLSHAHQHERQHTCRSGCLIATQLMVRGWRQQLLLSIARAQRIAASQRSHYSIYGRWQKAGKASDQFYIDKRRQKQSITGDIGHSIVNDTIDQRINNNLITHNSPCQTGDLYHSISVTVSNSTVNRFKEKKYKKIEPPSKLQNTESRHQ